MAGNDSSDPALLGILALLAADREERGDLEIPTELILTEAGLTPAQIGPMIGKSPGAVREKARRAKAAIEKGKKGVVK
ncbi:MAG TPA: hypothetical protein VFJ76_01580 [Solirubrobacterales bacterium]|nr:hypothetical protein [Solirubrobacterales bacterium]